MEMLFYNPEYLAPLNTGYRKVDGNGFLEGYDKENIRTVLESQAVKIDEYRNIISMGFNTPAMFKVVKLYAPWISNQIAVTDGRGIEYSSYAITTGDNTFRAGVRNLTTTSRRYSMSLDIDTDRDRLQLVASDKESVTTSSSEMNYRAPRRPVSGWRVRSSVSAP